MVLLCVAVRKLTQKDCMHGHTCYCQEQCKYTFGEGQFVFRKINLSVYIFLLIRLEFLLDDVSLRVAEKFSPPKRCERWSGGSASETKHICRHNRSAIILLSFNH